MQIEDHRPRMLRVAAIIMLLVTLTATIIMPILVDQSIYFTLVGAFNASLFALLYLLLTYTRPRVWHRYLLFFLGYVALVPLVIISNGANSQFAVIFPVIPFAVALLSSRRDAWVVTALTIVFLISLLFLSDQLPNLSNEIISENKTISKTVWLILTCLVSTSFAHFFDKTNLKLRKNLATQAYQDGLTGISNRRGAINSLEMYLQNDDTTNKSIALLMIDIDYFKQINDSHGHLVGDQCLLLLASSLTQDVRESEDIVARFGGEEFLIILTNIDHSNVLAIAEKIRANVEKLNVVTDDGESVPLTVTIGWHHEMPTASTTTEALLKQADRAMYIGKKNGRNQVVEAIL